MASNARLPRFAKYSLSALDGGSLGVVKIAGQTYQVIGLHAVAYRFLTDLASYLREQPVSAARLLPLKEDFRQIGSCYCAIGLAFSLQSNDPIQQRLAVWLLGRRGWRKAIGLLRDWPASAPWDLQFEIARTLKRIGGWEELRRLEELAHTYQDPPELSPELENVFSGEEIQRRRQLLARLRCITQQRPPRDYQHSLNSFLSHEMKPAKASTTDKEAKPDLWYQEPLGPGRQPKSLWLIRWFLKRIQSAVRG